MQLETWFLFFLTSIGMALTPGPNGLLALTHGALHGRRMTVWTISGAILGFTLLMALCMFGVGALVKTSIWWFTALKLVGDAYLVWIGIQVWRSPPIGVVTLDNVPPAEGWSLFRKGFLTATTNPKSVLFYTALLPQFIDPHRGMALQFAIIAITYAITEFAVEYGFAAAANSMSAWLARVGRRFNQLCGGVFVLVGLALPLR